MAAVLEIGQKVIPVKSASSWYQRSISVKSARVPHEKRTVIQKAGSFTFGQLIGTSVALIGVGDFFYKLFYSDSDSIWNKYITPFLITSLGLSGMASSASPPNVLGLDVISSGINVTLGKLKTLEDISLNRFTEENKASILESLEEVASRISTIGTTGLIELYQKAEQGFVPPHSALKITDEARGQLERIQKIEEGIRASWEETCSPRSRQLGSYYKSLFDSLNEGLNQVEMSLEHQYDRNNSVVNLYVTSPNAFSSPHDLKVNFKPFVLLRFHPEGFKKAISELNKQFTARGLSGASNQDKEIIQTLTQALIPFISSLQLGYFEVDKDSHSSIRRHFVNENIGQFLSRRDMSFLDDFFNSTDMTTNNIESLQADNTDDRQSIVLFRPRINSVKDVLEYLGGENFAIAPDDSDEMKVLKYSYSWLWIFKNKAEGFIGSRSSEIICREIKQSLIGVVPTSEYAAIQKELDDLKLPQKYLNIDLLLSALKIEGEPFNRESQNSVVKMMSTLNQGQQDQLQAEITRKYHNWNAS